MPPKSRQIRHNATSHRFEYEEETYLCVLEYVRTNDSVTFTHTGVPPPVERRGIAADLTEAGLQWARRNKLRVVPACSYVAAYIRRNPEHQDLL